MLTSFFLYYLFQVDEDSTVFFDELNFPEPVRKIRHDRFNDDSCYSLAQHTVFIYRENVVRDYQFEKDALRWMRGNMTVQHIPLMSPHILLTNRRKSRVIENFEDLVTNFEYVFGVNKTRVYDGEHTSLNGTVQIFNEHDVFVHFHGAAGANAIFMPPSSLVIEISTFINYESTRQWRSNAKIARVAEGIVWLVRLLVLFRRKRSLLTHVPPASCLLYF